MDGINSPDGGPPPRVTLKDVARRLGISHVSVSVALRDRAGVSPDLKARIRETATAMGYTPEPMARALAVYRHNKRQIPVHSALAWINFWPNPKELRSFLEFDYYWKGASEAALASGYRLEEFTLQNMMSIKRLEDILHARGIRGIMIPPHNEQIDWSGFNWKDFAIVKFGHSQAQPLAYIAAPDQVGDALLAYERVKAAGYNRIGYVGIREKVMKWWFSGALLMEQVLETTSDRIPPLFLKDSYSEPDYFVRKSTIEPIKRWLDRYKPQAIICETGDLRISIDKIGLKVPEEIAMANLSHNKLATLIDAGINQNPLLIGKAAVDTLVGLITRNEWGETSISHSVTVMGTWVEGSTMPPRR